MNSFLEHWLAAMVPVLRREISIQAELSPAAKLPNPDQTLNLVLLVGGGRFTVSAETSALHALLVEAGRVGTDSEAQNEHTLWRELIEIAAGSAAESFGGGTIRAIEETQWSLGMPSAAYELRVGNATMLVAFTDQVQADAPRGQEKTGPPPNEIDRAKPNPPGIDLLLGVELETSLRFGSCEMSLNEVLELGPGDVLELDRHVSDPVDLLVGDKIVARGEVVLVNGTFGLHVLEVAEPRKCLESVRCLF